MGFLAPEESHFRYSPTESLERFTENHFLRHFVCRPALQRCDYFRLSVRNLPLVRQTRAALSPIALPLRQKALDVCCNVILVYDHSYIGDRNLTGFVDQVCGWKRVQ